MNLRGANGLFSKCIPKLEEFISNNIRIENLPELINVIKKAKNCVLNIDNARDFDWDLVIKLKKK